MGGLLVVAASTGLPLALYELGASAGLNLMLDRFSYQLGSLSTGIEGSPIRLAPTGKALHRRRPRSASRGAVAWICTRWM